MNDVERMLDDICAYCKNYFVVEKISGVFTITDGVLALPDSIQEGQFIRIVGSIFNDGVHKTPTSDLNDETFSGVIWSMAVPPKLLKLIDEMRKWETDNSYALNSPYQSESKADYSYTLKTGAGGDSMTTINKFSSRFTEWRKI